MRIALFSALASLALVLPACGGDETTTTTTEDAATGVTGATGEDGADDELPADAGEAAGSEKKRVTDAVAAAIGSGDPDVGCETGVTAGYVADAYGDEQGCRAAITEQGGFGLVVKGVRISGDSAEATAVALDGPNANETLRVRLVSEDGEWKVDFLRSDAPAGP
jgi:hypothetical protein